MNAPCKEGDRFRDFNPPEVLDPCPFDGGKRVFVMAELRSGYGDEDRDDPDAWAWSCRCASCAAVGGWTKSRSGAVRLWNMRANP